MSDPRLRRRTYPADSLPPSAEDSPAQEGRAGAAHSSYGRRASLALSNLMLPVAVLVFATGFFPYKPVLPGLATFEDYHAGGVPEAVFDRVIFMVVDALRSDFVYGYDSGFEFTQSLIRTGAAIPFTAHATPPTVTMPRVKALTTGSVPSFLDLILNFAESDTTSTLATQDTWLAQLRARGDKIVFYGDDTWLKLFPSHFFLRADGTSSFFVSDFTEVDHNVTRHVPSELEKDDWSAMIMHYLGLDHIGHKTGPQGPNMLPKQREMDGIVRQIYEAMEGYEHHKSTLLVLAGDHGMNAGGNHGGSGPGETEPALLFASPKFKGIEKRRVYECPTLPKEGTEFHYYTKVEQSDLVPTLAGLMRCPIPKNSLGVFIEELGGLWRSSQDQLKLLAQNTNQLLHFVRLKYGRERFEASVDGIKQKCLSGKEHEMCSGNDLAAAYARVLHEGAGHVSLVHLHQSYYTFLRQAQEELSDTASSYDIPRMVAGMALSAAALLLAAVAVGSVWPPSLAGSYLTLTSLLYGVMMFASSYVEEEQHFWYWLTPAWVLLLVAKQVKYAPDAGSSLRVALAGAAVLTIHRLAVRWNQTGQKHAGEPDIVHTFFPEHHVLMWILILATYLFVGYRLHTRTFAGLLMPELTAFADVALIFLAVVFKLNFTQADAPELVQGLALRLRQWSEPFDLVLQARATFVVTAVAAGMVVWLSLRQESSRASKVPGGYRRIPLTERLHYLLTLFLMTQTRAPNVPLFLGLQLQRLCLTQLVSSPSQASRPGCPKSRITSPVAVAASVLLLSHVYYFCMGGSNSISSIDLSNAYNGVADYNIAAVGVLLFASNWGGPIWWCSAAVLLCTDRASTPTKLRKLGNKKKEREWVVAEREKLHQDAVVAASPPEASLSAVDEAEKSWFSYIACMTAFIATALLAVMAACTALRTHLFIWTVFSPKYLYALAWSLGWHLLINIGFGSSLYRLSSIR